MEKSSPRLIRRLGAAWVLIAFIGAEHWWGQSWHMVLFVTATPGRESNSRGHSSVTVRNHRGLSRAVDSREEISTPQGDVVDNARYHD